MGIWGKQNISTISCDSLLGREQPIKTFDMVTRQSCQPTELLQDNVFWQGTASVQGPVIYAPAQKHVLHHLALGIAALSWHSTRDTKKKKHLNV